MASNYGWGKNHILKHVYFDELPHYVRLINRRKIDGYKMALAISTNPHIKNPKELWNTLDQQERQNEGKEYVDAEFNQAEFDRFKVAVQGKSKSIIVK